jgi:hypothetical protein
VNNSPKGLNYFVVQLRDVVTGNKLPGIKAGDVGMSVEEDEDDDEDDEDDEDDDEEVEDIVTGNKLPGIKAGDVGMSVEEEGKSGGMRRRQKQTDIQKTESDVSRIAYILGSKQGRNGMDNGWIQFSNVKIPLENMMMKWATLDKNGL